MSASREVLWNISHGWLMYALLVPTLLIAGYGFYRRILAWRRGQRIDRLDRPLERLKRVWSMAVAQRGVMRDPIAGLLHASLFWGFFTLLIATTVVFVHHDFGVPIMQGSFYLYFQSLFVDLLGLIALVAAIGFGLRRWRRQPQRLIETNEANGLLVLIIAILASGFLLEGWRIAATDDPWGAWSPVGYVLAEFSGAVATDHSLATAHLWLWWIHLVMVFGLIAWAPYTKLAHVVTATLNVYASNLDAPTGKLRTIDFEQAETFGVGRIDQFTWKDLLDLDACTECGRCSSVCPAQAAGKRLSPAELILDLRAMSRQTAEDDELLIQDQQATAAEALWQCTTCAACVDACPVAIEQYTKIVDLRRYLVMEEAQLPRQMQEAVTSLEQRGHPFRGAQSSRTDWTDGVEAPLYDEVKDPEVLLWVGCGGALVERNQRTTRAVAQLLRRANVRFGILGHQESCTGDPARRIGNEFLFDTMARQNVETIDGSGATTVVTPCPHCFHSFKNEYPDFGGQWQVYHHTTYLAMLVGQGRLQLSESATESLTFHDPCYLGRHNGVTAEPRELLERVSGKKPIEMPRHGKQSFCCGAGGGMSFVDEPADQRVNLQRAQEALDTGVETVAVACPFCSTMLEDGLGAAGNDRNVQVKDIAELLWESMSSGNAEPKT